MASPLSARWPVQSCLRFFLCTVFNSSSAIMLLYRDWNGLTDWATWRCLHLHITLLSKKKNSPHKPCRQELKSWLTFHSGLANDIPVKWLKYQNYQYFHLRIEYIWSAVPGQQGVLGHRLQLKCSPCWRHSSCTLKYFRSRSFLKSSSLLLC